ncbi:hypothetical protein [Altericroceibacterium spongiae]|uniref:hypothetical protein n=1 Tax=Altericroceibacterium spongiae TaxID=2320269 RepID=UPI001EE5EEF7
MMDCHATIGPRVNCYNIAPLRIAAYAIVSQDAELVTGSHDPDNPAHPLVAAPITLGAHSWIAAGAFVGPGVTVGRGAVLGARCVCFKDCEEASIYIGNPARLLRRRNITF